MSIRQFQSALEARDHDLQDLRLLAQLELRNLDEPEQQDGDWRPWW
ncbi:MAG: hypothetical protein MI919_19880 [Holophagales bacterium]|nr:hypothetical protein [Holophagales bacterium]